MGQPGRRPKISPETVVKILEAHKNSTFPSAKRMGEAFGISRHAVEDTLRRHGMGKSNFNPHTVQAVLALLDSGLTHEQIGQQLGLAKSSVSQAVYENQTSILKPIEQEYHKTVAHRQYIAARWKPGRYVVGNDSHIKFHSKECLDAIMALKGDFDGFIMAGDLIDGYWVSSFRKSTYAPLSQEVAVATDIMKMFAKKFGRVLYFHGNHEERLWKYLLTEGEGLVKTAGPAAEILIKAFEDIRHWYFGNMPGVLVHYGWFVQIGKTVISHADLYSQMQGRTVQNILEHFLNRAREWQTGEIDAVLEAHLHRHSGPQRKWGRYLWELPCMCGPLDYQMGARASKGQTDTGYSIIVINKDGTFNFNESRSYLVDVTPPNMPDPESEMIEVEKPDFERPKIMFGNDRIVLKDKK